MKDLVKQYTDEFNKVLDTFTKSYEPKVPYIFDAVKYSILNGGKRIRPILAYLGAEFCGMNKHYVDNLALGIEMIHSYSLVHDDLPCMDNDDLRRGMPTTHKKYGEAMGVLAGDGLLTLAFEVMLYKAKSHLDCKAIWYIAAHAGINGMVGGQCIDIDNTIDHDNKLDKIMLLNSLKTSCLLQSALVGSAIKCGASDSEVKNLEAYSDCIGQIFQLVDDILDVHSTTENMGKTVGKDKDQNKNTYLNLVGEEKTLEYIKELEDKAVSSLSIYGKKSENLILFAKYLTKRVK